MNDFGIIGVAPTINVALQTGPRQLELTKLPRPRIDRAGGAIVRIEACGMCGSDIEQYSGHHSYAAFPYVPGHEPVGVIDEISAESALKWGVKVGDRVAIEPVLSCGHCEHCKTGHKLLCEDTSVLGLTSISVEPGILGAYAEYMYLPKDTIVHRIAPHVAPSTAVLFNPLGAGIRWGVTETDLAIGETIVILGCGQRGIAATIAARAAGAGKIIVTDVERAHNKLETALAIGADHIVVADRQDVIAEVGRLTGGRMADVVLDVTAATQPLADAIDLVRRGGRIVIGGVKGADKSIPLFMDRLTLRSVTLKGVFSVDTRAYRQALNMIEAGNARASAFSTQAFPLAATEEAIHRLAGWDGKTPAIHVMIDPWA